MGQSAWASRFGRPRAVACAHSRTISTVTAGLERRVCEGCGRVSIEYAGEGAFWPDLPGLAPARFRAGSDSKPPMVPKGKHHRCVACGSVAIYLTPMGLACHEHAWSAASSQVSFDSDFWIPRLIDGSRGLMNDLDNGGGEVIDLTPRDNEADQ